MNELQTQKAQLPDTIEDLTQFVLVGKAKLQAYMLKLQTVNKLSVAQEIRDQTLQEAQEVSTALIAAEQRIGELLLAIPKAQGKRTDVTSDERSTKVDVIKEMGYGTTEAKDYQQMAKHPEVVRKVLDDALADGTVVTKSQVMKEIREANRKATEENERLRRIVSEKEAENVRLKSQKVEVREVEVIPDDYEELKEKSRQADGYKKDFTDMRNRYEEMADKYKQSEKEKRSLIEEMKKPENEKVENIKRSALFFCAGVSNFIEKYGGYVWLSQEIDKMEESEKAGYVKAVDAIYAWSSQMKNNLGD